LLLLQLYNTQLRRYPQISSCWYDFFLCVYLWLLQGN